MQVFLSSHLEQEQFEQGTNSEKDWRIPKGTWFLSHYLLSPASVVAASQGLSQAGNDMS